MGAQAAGKDGGRSAAQYGCSACSTLLQVGCPDVWNPGCLARHAAEDRLLQEVRYEPARAHIERLVD